MLKGSSTSVHAALCHGPASGAPRCRIDCRAILKPFVSEAVASGFAFQNWGELGKGFLREGRVGHFRVCSDAVVVIRRISGLAEGEVIVAVEDEKSIRHAVDRVKMRQRHTRTGSPPPTIPRGGRCVSAPGAPRRGRDLRSRPRRPPDETSGARSETRRGHFYFGLTRRKKVLAASN